MKHLDKLRASFTAVHYLNMLFSSYMHVVSEVNSIFKNTKYEF